MSCNMPPTAVRSVSVPSIEPHFDDIEAVIHAPIPQGELIDSRKVFRAQEEMPRGGEMS